VSRFDALLVDFGGVLTTNVFDAFATYCASEGLAPDAFATLLRTDPEAAGLLRDVETGTLSEDDFEARFAPMLAAEIEPAGLIGRLTASLPSFAVAFGLTLLAAWVDSLRAAARSRREPLARPR